MTAAPHPRRPASAGLVTLALLAAALAAALAEPAHAHPQLTGSEPQEGATVTEPPDNVRLEFDEPIAPRQIRVTDPADTDLADGDPQANDTTVRQPIRQPARTGSHTIAYRVEAADGHIARGEIGFTYTGPTTDDQAGKPDPDDPTGMPAWVPPAALAALIAAAVALTVIAWRRLAKGDGTTAGDVACTTARLLRQRRLVDFAGEWMREHR